MNLNYLYTPCYTDSSLGLRLQEATDALRKAYADQFNKWLGDCVKGFCPGAWEQLQKHEDQISATRALNVGDFHYRMLPDGLAEFCQGDIVLSRAKFEFKFTVKKNPI